MKKHLRTKEQKNGLRRRLCAGSYTIEAALIVPMIMMVLVSASILIAAGLFEARMGSALEQVGSRFAYYYYAIEEIEAAVQEHFGEKNDAGGEISTSGSGSSTVPGGETIGAAAGNGSSTVPGGETIGSAAGNGKPLPSVLEDLFANAVGSVLWYPVSQILVKDRVDAQLNHDWASDFLVEGGLDGVSYFGSQYSKEKESIVLVANYEFKLPFASFLNLTIPVSHHSVHRVWSGKEMVQTETVEQMVYITETGTVYHTMLACSHLNVSVRSGTLSQVGSMRNDNGAKYYPCEYCGKGQGTVAYVTDFGTRYHLKRACSELKRGIKSVPLSEVAERAMCKTCASKSEGKK